MTITPLRDYVVFSLLPDHEPQGMIQVITDTKTAIRRGTVVKLGPECRDIQVGDVVLVNQLVCSQVGDFFLVQEPHILGTLP